MGLERCNKGSASVVALSLLAACAAPPQASPRDLADANDTGGTLKATSASEREILERLPRLANGAALRVGDGTVVGDAAYAAASGRTCRRVQLTQGSGRKSDRLACSDGGAWFFVPDVFDPSKAAD
jgi:hypothetical protein